MVERFGAPDHGTALGSMHMFEEQEIGLLKKGLFP